MTEATAVAHPQVIPYRPHEGGQRQFHDARYALHRYAACGSRFGKDRMCAPEALKVLLALGRRRSLNVKAFAGLVPLVHCWVVAPDYPRVEQFWRELCFFTPEQLVVQRHDTRKFMWLRVKPGGDGVILVEMKSAKEPESLVGVGLDLLIITEAALVKNVAWEAYLQPRLVSPGRLGMLIATGTPKGRNWFFREFQRAKGKMLAGDRRYWTLHAPTWMNPYIDRAKLREVWNNMPDLARRQELKAEFVGATGGVFFGVREAVRDLVGATVNLPLVIGIDWGKLRDATVFVLLEMGGQMLRMERMLKTGYAQQLGVLDAFYDSVRTGYGVDVEQIVVAAERNNVGERLCEELEEKYGPQLYPFTTGANKRGMIDDLAVDIQTGCFHLVDDEQLLNELEIFEYAYTSAGNVLYHAPDEAGAYDDCVMAAAIANAVRHEIIDYGVASRRPRVRAGVLEA
jgi:hypothetical protein